MAIVINGSGTVTGLAVGGLPDGTVDDGTLASNAVTEAKIATDAVTAAKIPDTVEAGFKSGRKNLIINGDMKISQRGSVNTADAGNEYTLDRWQTYIRGGALTTVSKDSDVPSGQGFGSSLKIDVTTADAFGTSNDLALLRTAFEGQDLQQLASGTSNAKAVTLSFWVKSTITGTYIAMLENYDTSSRFNSVAYTVNTSNTWEKKTITFDGDTSGGFNNDNGPSLEVRFWLGAGTNYTTGTLPSGWAADVNANKGVGQVNSLSSTSNNIYFTGVQLELGSTATDFEHRSYGEELALCQRYYHIMKPVLAGGGFGAGMAYSSTACFNQVFFPTVMRARPTKSFSAIGDFRILYGTGVKTPTDHETQVGNYGGRVGWTTSGLTAGDGIFIDASNTSTFLAFDAELQE